MSNMKGKIKILKMLIFIVSSILMINFVLGQNICGNEILEPPRASCDPGSDLESNEDDIFGNPFSNKGIVECSILNENLVLADRFLEGNVGCYPPDSQIGTECQLDVNNCIWVDNTGGDPRCISCNDANGDRDLCYACQSFCYYTLENGLCNDCNDDIKCTDYTEESDCVNFHRCALNENNPSLVCKWDSQRQKCKEDGLCNHWDCEFIKSEECSPTGFRDVQITCTWNGAEAGYSFSSVIAQCTNRGAAPINTKVPCIRLEEDFPVFTSFNLILSSILLIGYYFYRKRKL